MATEHYFTQIFEKRMWNIILSPGSENPNLDFFCAMAAQVASVKLQGCLNCLPLERGGLQFPKLFALSQTSGVERLKKKMSSQDHMDWTLKASFISFSPKQEGTNHVLQMTGSPVSILWHGKTRAAPQNGDQASSSSQNTGVSHSEQPMFVLFSRFWWSTFTSTVACSLNYLPESSMQMC